jgi:uncharacterized protein involved in outer membrane biogenesis
MKKILVRICIAVLALIVVVAMGLHFFLDSAIKRGVETVGPKLTKVDVKLGGVHISFLSGSGTLKGLVIGNPDGYKTPQAISVGTASLVLKPGTLLANKLVITSINVESPEITFEGSLKGFSLKDNLQQILDNMNGSTAGSKGTNVSVAGATPKEEKKANKKLEVDDFQITGAKLDASISGMEGKALTLPLPTIHLTNLGTGPEGITVTELSKKVIAAIKDAAEKEVASNAGNLGKSAASLTKGLGGSAGGGLTNITKGFGNLFKHQ